MDKTFNYSSPTLVTALRCVVCVREGDKVTQPRLVCKHIRASSLCLSRRLFSSLGLELMVKLRTLLTVFTLVLKDEACDYGKGRYISTQLAVFGQSQCTGSVGQSEQTVLVGRSDEAFERGGAQRTYNNVQYLKNYVFFEHKSMTTYSVTPNTQNYYF